MIGNDIVEHTIRLIGFSALPVFAILVYIDSLGGRLVSKRELRLLLYLVGSVYLGGAILWVLNSKGLVSAETLPGYLMAYLIVNAVMGFVILRKMKGPAFNKIEKYSSAAGMEVRNYHETLVRPGWYQSFGFTTFSGAVYGTDYAEAYHAFRNRYFAQNVCPKAQKDLDDGFWLSNFNYLIRLLFDGKSNSEDPVKQAQEHYDQLENLAITILSDDKIRRSKRHLVLLEQINTYLPGERQVSEEYKMNPQLLSGDEVELLWKSFEYHLEDGTPAEERNINCMSRFFREYLPNSGHILYHRTHIEIPRNSKVSMKNFVIAKRLYLRPAVANRFLPYGTATPEKIRQLFKRKHAQETVDLIEAYNDYKREIIGESGKKLE
ncbi:hypothetical protein [Spirochaeta dissipatitropha]